MYRWLALILALALPLAYLQGRVDGGRLVQAGYQRQTIQAAEIASRKEAERLVIEKKYNSLVEDLREKAREEKPSVAECLPVSRVLRLQKY